MAKDAINEYSSTAASNTDVGGVSLAEGVMTVSDINDSMREMMSHLADFSAGTEGIDVLNLQDDDGSASIKIQAPSAVTTTTTFTLPDGDGANNSVLTTNGSGTLSWSAVLSSIPDNSIGADEINISGNGTAGQAVVSDGDGSFSYSNLSTTNAADEPAGSQTLSSTTYTALDTTTITPSSTSAKILVMVMAKYFASGGGNSTDGYIQIKRDSTEFTDTEAQSRISEANASGHDTLVTFMVDSPSTTSQITYTLQGRKGDLGQNITVARSRISAIEV